MVSSGGALSRAVGLRNSTDLIKVPPPCLGRDLSHLFTSSQNSDCVFICEDEEMHVSVAAAALAVASHNLFRSV